MVDRGGRKWECVDAGSKFTVVAYGQRWVVGGLGIGRARRFAGNGNFLGAQGGFRKFLFLGRGYVLKVGNNDANL